MDCKKAKSNLIDYFYKELSSENSKVVQDHLEACNSCRSLYNKMSGVLISAELNSEITPNEFLATRIIAKLENKQPLVSRARVVQYFLRPVLVVSLVVLGIFTGIKISNIYTIGLSGDLVSNNVNSLATQFASENYLNTPNDLYLELYLNEKK
jgi:predicted anti-sigma-YlaC factor YlaD